MHGRQQVLRKQHQCRANKTNSKQYGPDLNPAEGALGYLYKVADSTEYTIVSKHCQAIRNNNCNIST